MDSTREIDWAETIAYKMTTALRFSGIIDEDDYKLEQSARNELAAIVRRWCIPMERIQDWKTRAEAAERRVAELEARLEIVGGRADDMAEWWKVANDDAERLRIRAAELEARLRLLSVTG